LGTVLSTENIPDCRYENNFVEKCMKYSTMVHHVLTLFIKVALSIGQISIDGQPPAISRAKCWYHGRLLITLHGRHYGRAFCLINLNISSFIVANLFSKICNHANKDSVCLLDNNRIWLRFDPHNNNVILCIKRNILY
jgi:hypothetical protein